MKISREWLQTYFNAPLPESAALSEALTFHAFEVESVENDVLDVKVTPNRGHDCLSHRGIAKELSAILQMPMKGDELRTPLSLEPKTDAVMISIAEPALCKRYVAGYIRGVKVAESPLWLKKNLESIGQRSINNVVDATNYVMFSLGQPLHAFAADQLYAKDGKYAINVRRARSGEKMMALDNKEYEFTDATLVIADAHTDAAIGIAGVKGGKPAGVTEATKDIIIESANFDGVSVRRTAAGLKLRTDASSRFEQQISPELAGYGMKSVAELIVQLAGGELVGFAEAYPEKQKIKAVLVTLQQINSVLGVQLSSQDIADAFSRLDLPFVQDGEAFSVTPPFERLDIGIPEDLIEEVGRVIGYDKVPAVELPTLSEKPAVNGAFVARENIRQYLVSEGFSEVFTSVFAEKGERIVANKVDGVKPYLRAELMTSLRDALDRNVRVKEVLGERRVKLFEIGTVWRNDDEIEMLGLAVEKAKKEQSASAYATVLSRHLGGGAVADVPEEVIEVPIDTFGGSDTPASEYQRLAPSRAERYQPFSRYPFIVRDVALWVPAGTSEESVLAIMRPLGGDLLVRADVFDRFEKDGRTSLAFRLVFQSFDKTLTDLDANARMESVYAALKEAGYEIR